MSEDTEIKREELQEMARAILSEIYNAESVRYSFEGPESSPRVNRVGFNSDDGMLRNYEERQLLREQAYNLKNQDDFVAYSDEFIPRQSRNEFLEQRLFRRKVRENAIGTLGETAEKTSENTAARSGSYPQADLPEKLSDIFCRDARRYDGAFERY